MVKKKGNATIVFLLIFPKGKEKSITVEKGSRITWAQSPSHVLSQLNMAACNDSRCISIHAYEN